jgi:hypothetical protein
MTDTPLKDRVPTPEKLEREARRLARVRHLKVVPDGEAKRPEVVSLPQRFEPDPKQAA